MIDDDLAYEFRDMHIKLREAETKIEALEAEVRELKMNAPPRTPPPRDVDEPEARDVRHDDLMICVQTGPDFDTSRKGITRIVLNAAGRPTGMNTNIYLGRRLMKTFRLYINRPGHEIPLDILLTMARLYTNYLLVSGLDVISGDMSQDTIDRLHALFGIHPNNVWTCQIMDGEHVCGAIARNFSELLDHVRSMHLLAEYKCRECNRYTTNKYANIYSHISDKANKKCHVKGIRGIVEKRKKVIDESIDHEGILANIHDDVPVDDVVLPGQGPLYEILEQANTEN